MFKRALIIKLRHHGDVLLSTPVFWVLKQQFPHLRIDAYVYLETKEILEGLSCIDSILTYDQQWKSQSFASRMRQEWKLLSQIRRNRYDLVINLTEGDRGAIAARFSKASTSVGFDPEGGGIKGKANWYTFLVKHTHLPRHMVDKNLDALRMLGIFPEVKARALQFFVPAHAKAYAETLSMRFEKRPFIIFHPTSRWTFKQYPKDSCIAVLKPLLSQFPIVLTGSSHPKELAFISAIEAGLGNADTVFNVAGKTTLKELAAIIQRARLLLCMDSLPLHLASTFKTPVVALFGPTSEQRWGPWQHPSSRVMVHSISCRPCFREGCGGSGRSDCLSQIPPKAVLEEIYRLLSL